MWITINHFKKIDCFDIQPNRTFNIEDITGLKMKSPLFMCTYKKCVSKNASWNGYTKVVGEYPYYKVECHPTIDDDRSIVQIFVMEGDNL